MSAFPIEFIQLLRDDQRYKAEAYQFVGEALNYAQEAREEQPTDTETSESHLTGQQLCDVIRLYALQQYGLLAQAVLNSWGVFETSDFGEIVYNLIRIGRMKKSEDDRREDFDDVYSFDTALNQSFRFTTPE
ncbi:MAG: Minf_1886 family protein [Planctomycetota bacterium]|nr:Minf_1886 family protein [Planctomycetota bacterium]